MPAKVGRSGRSTSTATPLTGRPPASDPTPAPSTWTSPTRPPSRPHSTTSPRTGSPAPLGVVCNAGIARFGPLLELDLGDWEAVTRVNLTGTFVVARAVARRMVEAGTGGAMVAITSMNGVAPGPNAGAYGPTKAAVSRLTQQMALEWAGHGIRVNAVAPGLIDAGMSEPIYADPGIRRRREGSVPAGRLGTPGDVAAAVLFLLSEQAGYVNGVELLVDGGVTMSIIGTLPRPSSVDSVGPGGGEVGHR